MKHLIWNVYIIFILISIYINRLKCTKLHPCGDLDRTEEINKHGDKWLKWGQLYSYCMQNYNLTQVNSTTCDQGCRTSKYKECISVCYKPSYNKTLGVCEHGCKTEECRIGCRFYDYIFNKKGNFTLDENNLPSLNSTVIREKQNNDSVIFRWAPVQSHGERKLSSIYLISIRPKMDGISKPEPEIILGLINVSVYTATMEDMCAYLYHGYKYKHPNLKFAIRVYPINFNGPTNIINSRKIKISFVSKYTYPTKVLPIQNLTIASDSPFFNKEGGYFNILWKLKWVKSMDNRSIGVRCKYDNILCSNTERKRQMLNLNNFDRGRYYDASKGYCNIPIHNTKDDHLDSCKIDIQVVVKYGKCFLSDPVSKQITYQGCKYVRNYTNPCPVPTNPPLIDTRLKNVSITDISLSCNSTQVYTKNCIDDNSSTCDYCRQPKYNITVNWLPLNITYDIHSYTVRWGIVDTNGLLNREGDVSLSPNITSYGIETLRKDEKIITFGIQVHAETDVSKTGWHWDEIRYTIVLGGSELKRTPKSRRTVTQSNTSTIIIVVFIIVTLVAILFGGITFKFYRNRLMQKRETNSNISDEIYMTSEKAVITDEWEIYPSNIKINEKIGEGAFGTVYSATIDTQVLIKSKFAKQCGGVALLNDKTKTAVKFLKDGAQDEEQNDFQDEILLMKSIGYHKNIVNMIGCSTIKQPLCLIVEYMHHGDLLHYMRKQRSNQLNNQSNDNHANNSLCADDMMSFAWQIACGMEYLSTNNVVHRDLAARNILVGSDKNVKISDFGLSRQITNEPIYISSNKTRKLPVKWMSVEAIYHKEFTVASDVWAYGVVLFEIVTLGGAPYPFIGHRDLCKMLKSGYRMEKPDNCTGEIYDIMLHCWNQIPWRRPTFTELREHLEKIMEQGDRYFSFEIDDRKAYYNVASFKSIPSDDEEDTLFTKEYDEKPIQVKVLDVVNKTGKAVDMANKTIDNILKEKPNTEDPNDENETARYISPQSLKSFTDIEKSVSFDNPNFHFHE